MTAAIAEQVVRRRKSCSASIPIVTVVVLCDSTNHARSTRRAYAAFCGYRSAGAVRGLIARNFVRRLAKLAEVAIAAAFAASKATTRSGRFLFCRFCVRIFSMLHALVAC